MDSDNAGGDARSALLREVCSNSTVPSEVAEQALDWVLAAAQSSWFNMYFDLDTVCTQLRLATSVSESDLVDSLKIHRLLALPEGVAPGELIPVIHRLVTRQALLKKVIDTIPADL